MSVKKPHTVNDVKEQLSAFGELIGELGQEIGSVDDIEKLFGKDAELAYKFMSWVNEGLKWLKRGFQIGLVGPMIKRVIKKYMK